MAAGIAIVACAVLAVVVVAVRHHLRRQFDSDAYTHAQRLVAIGGGRRMNLYCTGSGEPAVVLDAGLAGTTLAWRFVQPDLAHTTTVCSYDRAGMGFSDPGPLPRSSSANADDLHALLAAAHVQLPAILVGHSLGAMDVRLDAYRHPGDAAALVLVDSADEDEKRTDLAISPAYWTAQVDAPLREMQRCRAEHHPSCDGTRPFFTSALNAERLRESQQRATWDTEISELQSYDGRSGDELRAARHTLGSLPIIVLTHTAPDHDRGVSDADEQRIASAFLRIHEREASDSTRGISRTIPRSGHDIELDRPRAVVDAVREMIRDVRG